MGILFQIPVGILAATRLGIVTPRQLRKNRRYAILVIAVVAMLLPGTDPVTMLIAMLPLIVLFEGSILLASVLDRRRPASGDQDEADVLDGTAEAATAEGPGPTATPAVEPGTIPPHRTGPTRLMLFDLRGRGRRRTVQVIYIGLAILMVGGLLLFGIGGGGLRRPARRGRSSATAAAAAATMR